MQILYCIKQSKNGGENTLVDGFAAAEKLKQIDIEAFKTLSTVKCLYFNIGKDIYGKYHFNNAVPIISYFLIVFFKFI